MKLVKLIMHLKRTVNRVVNGERCSSLFFSGAKVVDTRCHEYTDEPRQNVVKFLGIPIVHMSKQPDIIIKVCCSFRHQSEEIRVVLFSMDVCLVNAFHSRVIREVW